MNSKSLASIPSNHNSLTKKKHTTPRFHAILKFIISLISHKKKIKIIQIITTIKAEIKNIKITI